MTCDPIEIKTTEQILMESLNDKQLIIDNLKSIIEMKDKEIKRFEDRLGQEIRNKLDTDAAMRRLQQL